VAWLLPELELGVEPELKPLELLEFELPELPVLVLPVLVLPLLPVLPVLPVLELLLLVLELLLLVLVLVDVEDDDAVLWVDPGRARVTAPAATTLARVTAVVVERTLARPRARAAVARWTLSRSVLLISPILRSRIRGLLEETSRLAMSGAPWVSRPGPRLFREHEGLLKPLLIPPRRRPG
jgi:hypothetical protein